MRLPPSVLCVGLGSSGSTVADLLARSCVGRFVLWDNDSLEAAMRGTCTDSERNDELFFDPAKGELRSARSNDDSDHVPATQMAHEGFSGGAARHRAWLIHGHARRLFHRAAVFS